MTAGGKERLDDLVAGAVEAEPDAGRHRMEEAVLATLAKAGLDDPGLWEAFGRLRLKYWREHMAAIAYAIGRCVLDGVAVHPDTVRARLSAELADSVRRQVDAALPGLLDGSKTVDGTVATENAKTLSTLDRLRDAEAVFRDASRDLEEAKTAVAQGKARPDAAEAALTKVVAGLMDAGTKRGLAADPPLAGDRLSELMDALDKRRKSERAGLDYGCGALNDVLAGLGPGLFIFGGITSCGKTSLMSQIADHVAAVEQIPVLFFGYEQGAEELLVKSLSRQTVESAPPGIDIGAIQNPWKVSAEDWEGVVRKAEAEYIRGPGRFLRIIDAGPEHTVEKIRGLALIAKRREEHRRAEAGTAEQDATKPPVLVIVDYLQIVPAVNPSSGRDFLSIRERVDFVLTSLRRLSRELGAPVLLLVSLNREGYDLNKDSTGRVSASPSLTVFKESGGIEYAADVAFCLAEDEVESRSLTQDFETETEVRRVILFCLKNRNGQRITLEADFYPAFALFHDVIQSKRFNTDAPAPRSPGR